MADLFDSSRVPSQVVSASGVAHVNEVVNQLRSRQVKEIVIQESGTYFRISNKIRAYAQAHLWRCIELIESAYSLVCSDRGLVTLMAVRSIYETVAEFIDFEDKIQPLFIKGDFDEIFDFVHSRSFSTRLPEMIERAGTPTVKATSVLTQIDKMNKIYSDCRSDYDYLCEYTHPNAFGAFLYYTTHDKEKDVFVFSSTGPSPNENLKWVLISGKLLGHFLTTFDRLENALPALSELARQKKPNNHGNTVPN